MLCRQTAGTHHLNGIIHSNGIHTAYDPVHSSY
jgi:hypothetical protein